MEPIPPEQGAATGPGHELIIEGREELLYLLGETAELERSVCCTYLYAAFSLRAESGAGLTAEQLPVVAGWKRTINQIALQEMIHLALVNNLLAALGGAPSRSPQPSPALLLRTRDPADPDPFQRTDAAAIPPHRAARRHGHLHDGRRTGRALATSSGADRTAGYCRRRRPSPASGSCTTGSSEGCAAWSTATGKGQVFVGSPNAQASTRYFRVPEHMPELIPVTGLTSATQAIKTIVEEGEGARGSWQGAHFGRFLTMLEDYQALAADDPSFAPAHPAVANSYVRVPRDLLGVSAASGPAAPDDPFRVHLIQDRYTAAVSDLFNACSAAMLQLLYRFFQHTEETDAELSMLGETAVLMMLQIIRPLGELLTRLPVGPHAPGMTAGGAARPRHDRRAELHGYQRDPDDPAQAGGLDHPRRTATGAG
jgi:hypothetical protein